MRAGRLTGWAGAAGSRPLVLSALALALGCGCAGDGGLAPGTPADASIRVTANTAGTTVATLVVEVSAADIAVPLVFNIVVDGETGIATGTLRVKPGPERSFAVTAFDAAGEPTHEGFARVDVRPGPNPPVQVPLGPRSGQVPVVVTFGSWSVVVTPANAMIGVGGAVALTAEVLDEEGTPLANPVGLLWATTDPSVAGVDAAGLVTGRAPGTAAIVATFEGVAGLAMIAVE